MYYTAHYENTSFPYVFLRHTLFLPDSRSLNHAMQPIQLELGEQYVSQKVFSELLHWLVIMLELDVMIFQFN